MAPDPNLSLPTLTATEAALRLRGGALTVSDYVNALLARVFELEPQVQAWTHLDTESLRVQAAALDAARLRGEAPGPLFGLPIGLKDVIDTADMPTENGTVLHAGRRPVADATLVARLRAAGALVMGKTVTTELATYAPGKTRNPHDLNHSPGGSSSGSAAAVAAGMAPLAVGTQTNGSVIRPASFCGVYGFKPSAGLIPRTGVLTQSPSFDAVGVFGRSLEDVALLAQVLAGVDGTDLIGAAATDAGTAPSLAWVATPFWARLAADAQQAFEALVKQLGPCIQALTLPGAAATAVEWHKTAMEAEIAISFAGEYERGRDRLSPSLCGQIERGRRISAADHAQALAAASELRGQIDAAMQGVDAILTPASLGTAPAGLSSTGDPLMCTLWTCLGMPALNLPLLRGANGLPLGVQLVGRRGDDAGLLRAARRLLAHLHSGPSVSPTGAR